METPICDFGKPAVDFNLADINGKVWSLVDCPGTNGLLVMFICNHCPYVKSIQDRLVRDTNELKNHGINSVAIMSNDPADYPEDSIENMRRVSKEHGYQFPYLIDSTQDAARAYGAVCTPDFFGYNAELELQFRGRLDNSGMRAVPGARRELFEAMQQVAEKGKGPIDQIPSVGCSIKWFS